MSSKVLYDVNSSYLNSNLSHTHLPPHNVNLFMVLLFLYINGKTM